MMLKRKSGRLSPSSSKDDDSDSDMVVKAKTCVQDIAELQEALMQVEGIVKKTLASVNELEKSGKQDGGTVKSLEVHAAKVGQWDFWEFPDSTLPGGNVEEEAVLERWTDELQYAEEIGQDHDKTFADVKVEVERSQAPIPAEAFARLERRRADELAKEAALLQEEEEEETTVTLAAEGEGGTELQTKQSQDAAGDHVDVVLVESLEKICQESYDPLPLMKRVIIPRNVHLKTFAGYGCHDEEEDRTKFEEEEASKNPSYDPSLKAKDIDTAMEREVMTEEEMDDIITNLQGRGLFKAEMYKVLKSVHQHLSLTAEAASIVNDILTNLISTMCEVLPTLNMGHGPHSVQACQTLVRLVLPDQLAKFGLKFGTKAMTDIPKTREFSLKAEKFSQLRHRVEWDSTGKAFLGGFLDYICAELMELGGNAAIDQHQQFVSMQHLVLAIENDSEFQSMLKGRLYPVPIVIPQNYWRFDQEKSTSENVRKRDARAMAEINDCQCDPHWLIPRKRFRKLTESVGIEITGEQIEFSDAAIEALQTATEMFLIEKFRLFVKLQRGNESDIVTGVQTKQLRMLGQLGFLI